MGEYDYLSRGALSSSAAEEVEGRGSSGWLESMLELLEDTLARLGTNMVQGSVGTAGGL